MTALRERTTRAAGAGRPLPLSAALLLARSFALVALAAVALLVALAAWFAVRAALAVDPVVATERVWLQYGHHRPPYAHVKLDPLKYNVPGPAYDVSLEATLPVNENNLRLGNFMVSLSLVDSLGSRAVNVSRPVGLGRELQVYEAWIKVQVKPKGLRAFVHRHPWITFLFFFPTFLTLEAIAAVAIYLYFVATAPSSFSSAKHSLEVRAGEEEDLRTTPLPFGGSGSGASSPLTTTTNNESEEPPTSATPSDYEHLLDDSELVHGDEEEEVAAAAAARRVEERRRRRRQESMRLGRGGVGMSAASLGGGGGGGAGVEAEVEAGETESYMEGDSASDGDGRGGEETGVGFGLEEMEEAEWVKGEEDQEEVRDHPPHDVNFRTLHRRDLGFVFLLRGGDGRLVANLAGPATRTSAPIQWPS
ncbi:hypothetical protein B0A53_06414 [Rhodotorula sp. CCFEE 5036]|nr:hypothetical protein B0A53_06414 [Rhodotorula sp. CCFEE 5036]